MTLTLTRSPTLAGTDKPVRVDKRTFVFPGYVRLAHSQMSGGKVLYALDPLDGNRVHVFVEEGEVLNIPAEVLAYARKKIFQLDGDDADT